MQFYYVGFTMRSATHDYSTVEKALLMLNGEKVSPRIWRCEVNPAKSGYVFTLARLCLADGDELIVRPRPDVGDEADAVAA